MDVLGFDAYSPPQIAAKVAEVGVVKARLPALALLMLGIAAGGFIGLGAMYYTLIVSDPLLSFGWARLLGCWFRGLALLVSSGELRTISAGAMQALRYFRLEVDMNLLRAFAASASENRRSATRSSRCLQFGAWGSRPSSLLIGTSSRLLCEYTVQGRASRSPDSRLRGVLIQRLQLRIAPWNRIRRPPLYVYEVPEGDR